MALQLTIGGVDYTQYLMYKSIKTTDSVEVKGDTFDGILRFDVGAVDVPLAGNELIFTRDGTKEFAGVLVTRGANPRSGNQRLEIPLSCMDYTYLLDRRYVNNIYTSQTAGSMVKAILLDLKNAAANESVLGDAHYNYMQGNVAHIQDGPVVRQMRFDRVLPSQAFDLIAEASGMNWFVDFDKEVNLFDIQDLNAPLPLSLGRAVLNMDTDLSNYFEMNLEETILNVGTKPILSNTGYKSTDVFTDEFTFETGGSQKFILSRRPFSETDIQSVKVNTTTYTQKLDDVARDASDETAEANTVFIFIGPTSYVRFPTGTPLTNNDDIEVKYNYTIADDHENFDPITTIDMAIRTGGDGIHEFVFSKLSNLQVENIEDLDVISEIILDRKSTVLIRGAFHSWTNGWKAGQVFDLVWPALSLDDLMYVISVQKQILTPADGSGDPRLVTEVQFSNIPRGITL